MPAALSGILRILRTATGAEPGFRRSLDLGFYEGGIDLGG